MICNNFILIYFKLNLKFKWILPTRYSSKLQVPQNRAPASGRLDWSSRISLLLERIPSFQKQKQKS